MTKPGILQRIMQFFQHVIPALVKPMRTLWNEIIGFLFLVLAVWALPSGIRSAREFDGDSESIFKVIMTGVFIVTMRWFGISSLRRARKISRS